MTDKGIHRRYYGKKLPEVDWFYPSDYNLDEVVIEFNVPEENIDSSGVVRIDSLGIFVKLKNWGSRDSL